MSRNNVQGRSIKELTSNLLTKLENQNNHQPITAYGTLKAMGDMPLGLGMFGRVCSNLYRYLYQFFHIYIHDMETNNPRHQCIKNECSPYCLLPLYANRCMSERKVTQLYQELRSILYRNPSLIAAEEETNEKQTTQNLLKYFSSQAAEHNLIICHEWP